MLKIVGIILTIVITSFYFFPFEFSFLPGMNTKMIMAAIGLVILGVNLLKGEKANIGKDFFVLSLFAIVVSLFGQAAIIVNNTHDQSYSFYIMSMWVWLGGAYTVINMIRLVHGRASLLLVCHYLIAVCVCQCLLAFTMGQYAPLKNAVDGILGSSGFMGKVDGRIYGLGASLDVAGMRFAAILSIIAYLAFNTKKTQSTLVTVCYLTTFFIIGFFGNMIGRSTTIGVGLAIMYWCLVTFFTKGCGAKSFWQIFSVLTLLFVPVIIYFYNVNASVHSNVRFAFEGFFSLWEHGTWNVHSNNILKSMVVFPDNMKTWLIGDGYFENPYFLDPYYIGPRWHGYYMQTDIGYLRFIFYFGVFGLLSFCAYMLAVGRVCMQRFPHRKMMFLMALALNFIIWFKVSSDLFSLFALFLCVSQEENDEYERLSAAKEQTL